MRWRKRWDSNPRDHCWPFGFQDRRLKPLGHASVNLLAEPIGFEPMRPLPRPTRFPSERLKPLGQDSAKRFSFNTIMMAGRPGLEPRPKESESFVLPLNYHPISCSRRAEMKAWRRVKDSNPRSPFRGSIAFEATAFSHSANPPITLSSRLDHALPSFQSRYQLSDVYSRTI